MNRIYVLLILNLLFFAASGTAQSNIPTLKAQLRISNADSCQLYYELGKVYEEVNLDSCFYYLKASLAIAERRNNTFGVAQAMQRIGYTYIVYKRDDGKAVEWLNKTIAVAKTTNDNLNLARGYQYLGLIAFHQDSNKADELLARALTYSKAANDWDVLAQNYDLLATLYAKQKKFKEASTALLNAMNACEPYSPDDWLCYGLDYVDKLIAQDRKEEAYKLYPKLEGVKDKLKRTKGDFIYFMDLGRLETKLKNFVRADSILQHALTIEKGKTVPDTFHIAIIYRSLLSLNIAKGDIEKTFQIVADLIALRVAAKESRLTQDTKVKMTELNSSLELEKKEVEINLLNEQKKNQRLLLIGTVIIALLLGSFLLILQRNKRRIEEQKAELIAINATKDKLFSIISHDLRAPIGALKGHLMMTNYGAMSQEEFSVASKRLTNNVNALFQTLDNLLHWSFAQQKGIKTQPENISLHAIANEEIQFLTEIAHQKGITVVNDIAPEATAFADRNQIGLVIRNLVSNSLKFTHSGGKIRLESFFTEGGKTTLKISDNGIGMSQTRQNQLFKIQGNTSRQGTSEEKGQGLGLILVKEMVEANGGTLRIESAENQGTTIVIILKAT